MTTDLRSHKKADAPSIYSSSGVAFHKSLEALSSVVPPKLTEKTVLGSTSPAESHTGVPFDPRPRLPSSTTGEVPAEGGDCKAAKTEKADPLSLGVPVQRFMQRLVASVTDPQVVRQYRVIKISKKILDVLHRISPKLLGGDGLQWDSRPDQENSLYANRKNAWSKKVAPQLPEDALAELHELLVQHCASLPVQAWKNPRHHRRFLLDCGWPVYVLKLHQLVLCCMQPESRATEEAASAASGAFQSNVFEARSLWAAAVHAVQRPAADAKSPHPYTDNIYRDYHRTGSRAFGTAVTGSTEVSERGGASTTLPSDAGEDTAASSPTAEDTITSMPVGELYIALMDGASDYQSIGTPASQNFMPAVAEPPHADDVVSYVETSAANGTVICLDCDMLSFAINAAGRYDAYLWAIFLETVLPAVTSFGWEAVIPGVFRKQHTTEAVRLMISQRARHGLRVMRTCLKGERWGVEKCEYLSHMLLSSNQSAVEDTLQDLVTELWYAAFHRDDTHGLKRLEGVLVALLGHQDESVRYRATLLLNMFYDQHDWQSEVPFVPVIKEVGDAFELSISLDDAADPAKGETPQGVFVILSAPCFNSDSPFEVYSYHPVEWTPTGALRGRIPGLSRQCAMGERPAAGQARHKWIGTLKFGQFPRCGFYDWRVVRINEELGSWETVQAAFSDMRRSASSSHLLDLRISLTPDERDTPVAMGKDTMVVGKVYPHPQRMAELLRGLLTPGSGGARFSEERRTFPLQGRFVVQPRNAADEQVHEIFIDQHGIQLDSETGRVNQRGTFASVTASLSQLRDSGITTVYLMGVLSRDHGTQKYQDNGVTFEREDASPFAVTCRATPNAMSGGSPGLLNLLKEARRVGIKIICDAQTRVSSSRPHRKYVPHLLSYIDGSGKKSLLYGSGGRSASFEDTCQLNYRKVECWDLMVSDMRYLATVLGVNGFRIENCQACPPIMVANATELQRTDADGVAHYSVMEQLLADVVVPMSEEDSGFWSSAAAKSWANPFLVKLCKELWRDHPELVLVGECFGTERGDDRQSVLARSGVIPQLQDVPIPLAKMFGHQIDVDDASVVRCEPSSVKEIIDWFDSSHSGLPEGAIVLQSSCSHNAPLPGLLYGRGAWPAVDLLFFLPDIPSTFANEIEGGCFRLDIANVFSSTHQKKLSQTPSGGKSPLQPLTAARGLATLEPLSALSKLEEEQVKQLGPEFGFDLKKINGHYMHRRSLRHRFKIFRSGILVPLSAMCDCKWHPRVLTFLRFDAETGEFILVGINFSESNVTDVEVSLQPLSYQFRDMGMESNTVFLCTNLFRITESTCIAQTRRDAKLHRIGSHRELGSVPMLGGRHSLGQIFKCLSHVDEVYFMAELLHRPQTLTMPPYSSVCIGFKPIRTEELSPKLFGDLYSSSLARLEKVVRSSVAHAVTRREPVPKSLERVLRFNFVMETLMAASQESGLDRFAAALLHIQEAIGRRRTDASEATQPANAGALHDLIVDSGLFSSPQQFDTEKWKKLCSREGGGASVILSSTDEHTALAERFVAKMTAVAKKIGAMEEAKKAVPDICKRVAEVATRVVDENALGPIVFVTTELGKWSTVGGLGVMVDELSCTLAQHLGQTVYIVTPYYNYDRKGNPAYMDPAEVQYKFNITVEVAGEKTVLGVHEGKVRGVNLIFLHNARFFPHPYPDWNVPDGLRFLSLIGKASLEVLCQKRLLPQLIVTNDWPTGLVAAYAKNPYFFGQAFSSTTFFHIVHNLDSKYEGRIYADRNNNYGWITELNTELLVDPTWAQYLFNPSRCALMTCDAWGTVSPSYRDELRRPGGSALAPLLNRYPTPFAYPNGVPLKPRLQRLAELPYKTHKEAKAAIQKKYFGFDIADHSIPLFAFIGRITEQKGVHLIVEAAEQLIHRYQCRIQILVGGKVSWSDPYSAYCGSKMEHLRRKYPFSFWADPNEFFSDGPLVNLGADVGLMPSKFEPGGIVQHEFFIAGTPVLAFRTGGLRDTVYEFDIESMSGNGFTFEAYQLGDFLYSMERAHRVVKDPVKYERLRENAKYSVISCEQVAQAWLGELCRLRRKLPVNYGRVEDMAKKFADGWDIDTWASTASVQTMVATAAAPEGAETGASSASSRAAASTTVADGPKEATSVAGSSSVDDGLVPVKLRYTPRGSAKPRAVAVSGSFDNWQVRRPMTWEHAVQTFTLNLALPPGKYTYKLIVDGDWELNPDDRVEVEGGIRNNVFVVE